MKKIVILLVITLFFVSGCLESITNLFPTTTSITTKDDVLISFIADKPPQDTLYEGDEFQVGVDFTNYAKRQIEGQLCISDSPADTYGGIPNRECEDVILESAEGTPSKYEANFPTLYSYNNLQEDLSMSTIIIATFKYLGETSASPQVCIKRDRDIKVPSNIPCSDSETISGSKLATTNAPIAINSIKKSVAYLGKDSIRLMLEIEIKKISDGDIIDKDLSSEDVPEEQFVDFSASFLGLESAAFRCTGIENGQISLKESPKIVRCSAPITMNQDYYFDPLIIKLDYGFKKTVSTGTIKLIKGEEYL